MNQLPARKNSSNQATASPSFQSFRGGTLKTPTTTLLSQNKQGAVQQPVQQPNTNSKSPKQPAHSHKNSQVDIGQLTRLIKQHKDENTQSSMHSYQQQLYDSSNSQISAILAKAKEINMNLKYKPPSSSSSTSKQHSRNGSGTINVKAPEAQTTQKPYQAFLNYMQLKDIQHQKHKTSMQDDEKEDGDIKSSFNFLFVIGIGGFGKVWKVELRKKGILYAMKEMSKALVITKKSVNSVMNERQLLCSLKHPFLVNMHYAFQDRENLYLVMDFMLGGDLRYHIGRMRRFNEETTKFFVACIFIGLEYLHNNNIIHRDIKPENLVLDDRGYVRVTDLGIARVLKNENAQDTSGTPGYMAPEVMCRQNHTFSVDYFALGVIAYEFMIGRRPYVGRSRQEIRDQILAKQVQLKKSDVPEGWSLEGADFINRLIQRKPQSRLGWTSSQEIRLHPWFKNFPWNKLLNKELSAPFIPNHNDDNFDKKQIYIEDEENAELIQQNMMLLRDNSVQELFVGYEFNSNNSHLTTDYSSGYSSSKHSRTQSGIATK